MAPTTFHGRGDTQRDGATGPQQRLSYAFSLHQHPYAADLVRRLLEDSVRGLQAADTEYTSGSLADGGPRPELYDGEFFGKYDPRSKVAQRPVKELDFKGGAYSAYNWELFFHVPLTIAIHLSKNGRYEAAQKWFHYIFDPTDGSDGPAPERFWKVREFQTTDIELIQEILLNLATRKDKTLALDAENAIAAWTAAPFRPHLVARHRPSAYMFKTVMAYLDNLIAWGDSLYRQDTRETINEATQLYVLAAGILGPRPQAVPRQATARPQTYADLQADLDRFGNAAREVETDIPFELVSFPPPSGGGQPTAGVRNIGMSLYFGVPRNDRLLGYWDTVADRLFKIRNSLNALGIFRQLPLYEPPIDPALLMRATAAGVDVPAVVAGVNQPLPLVRFSLLVQKASEIAQEVRTLGSSLLNAMEKGDAEALQILRARHERAVLEAAENVRYGQLQEAIKNREALERSLQNAVARYEFYEQQLGMPKLAVSVPGLDQPDAAGLARGEFQSNEPEDARLLPRSLRFDLAQGAFVMSPWEAKEQDLTLKANAVQGGTVVLDIMASTMSAVGQAGVNISPWGIGLSYSNGGSEMAGSISHIAGAAHTIAGVLTSEAGLAAKAGSYARRQQEWGFQSNVVKGEIWQLYKQIRGAQIREAIAERELTNHRQQIENAKQIEAFLSDERLGKATNQAFYTWMKREVKGLHGRCFDLAFEVARKAERALQHELGDSQLKFLESAYMAGNEGLLAGERLLLDVRRMEMAYHDLNRREYELTKHASLLQLDPTALLELRTNGRCTVSLPEELYDLSAPGHYFRRIKSVALTVAGVTGPYTGVNATLTLLRSTIRRSSLLASGKYAREGADDDRFSDSFGSLDSIVTSTGQNDGGLFDTNLRDERMLPFEGHGAVSTWQLALPNDVRVFDYDTIADVVLHVRYTAREGGEPLKTGAVGNLEARFKDAAGVGSVRLFSVRNEFPGEWAKFKVAPAATLELELRDEHYPYWSLGRLGAVKSVDIYAQTNSTSAVIMGYDITPPPPASTTDYEVAFVDGKDGLKGIKICSLAESPLKLPTGTLKLSFNDTSMDELWIAIAWAKK
jgi:Tc toxin complex TcA C-terminal TcB-binding domain